MKIAILTQPLHNNYGGLLQAFALQYHLRKIGHEVFTVDFVWNSKPRFWGLKRIAENIVKKHLLKHNIDNVLPPSIEYTAKIGQHTNRFIAENIRTTQRIYSESEFSFIKNYNFDVFIVGSDQVWRPTYSPGQSAFFLSFLSEEDNVKRISYAASFGVDHCDEFTKHQLEIYAKLLKRFDAISVREDSAIALCKKFFNVDALQVIDPTLLLEKEIYCQLVAKDNISSCPGNMMAYVLDRNNEKNEVINKIAEEKNLSILSVMPDNDGIYPPVTEWLSGFMNSEYVVTDSFHGVVFSIIFNKPFIAIGNHDRGLARFKSILKIFSLESRLIFSPTELTSTLINSTIDYASVNSALNKQREIAMDFIKSAL